MFSLIFFTLLPFVVSPGASFALTLSAAAQGVRYGATQVWLGTSLGLVLLAFLVAGSGFSQWLLARPVWSAALTALGGGVLMAFAWRTLRRQRGKAAAQTGSTRLIATAFWVLISNIKALSIYVLVVPTLARNDFADFTLYASFVGLHSAMLLGWLWLLSASVRYLPGFAQSPRLREGLIIIAAVTMAIMGLRALISAMLLLYSR